MSWQSFPPSAPRPVEGGLAARSARGAIGEHWWSRRFVDVLESFALGTRLTRGRVYARKGQVVSLDVAPGVVTASVQGSRRTPYRVRIALAPFPQLVWAKVEVALAEQAVHSALLLAGQMPADLEGVFSTAGAPLFPQQVSQLGMSCSCPDGAVPCKHLAATFYLLAERFDDDPFEILHWRGRRRSDLLARLADLRGGSEDDVTAETATTTAATTGRGVAAELEPASAAAALVGLTRALRPDDAAEPAGWPAPLQVSRLPSSASLPADLLLRQLPPAPASLGGPQLDDELAAVYRALDSPTP